MTSILETDEFSPVLDLQARRIKRLNLPKEMSHITTLNLSQNPLQTLSFLRLFPNVENLALNQLTFKSQLLEQLVHCQKLRTLCMRNLGGDVSFARIPELQHLQTLDLSANLLTQDYFKQLQLRSLKILHFGQEKMPLNSFTLFRDVFLRGPCEFADQGYVVFENLLFNLVSTDKYQYALKVKKMKQNQKVPNFEIKVGFYSLVDNFEVQSHKQMPTRLADFLQYQIGSNDFVMRDYAEIAQLFPDPKQQMYEDSRKLAIVNGDYYNFVVIKVQQTRLIFTICKGEFLNFEDLESQKQDEIENINQHLTNIIIEKEIDDEEPSQIGDQLQEASENGVDFIQYQKQTQVEQQQLKQSQHSSPQKPIKAMQQLSPMIKKVELSHDLRFIQQNYRVGDLLTVNGAQGFKVEFFMTQLTIFDLINQVQMIITQQKKNFQDFDIRKILVSAISNYNKLTTPLVQNDCDAVLQLNIKINQEQLPFIIHFQQVFDSNGALAVNQEHLNKFVLIRASSFNKQSFLILQNEIQQQMDSYLIQLELRNTKEELVFSQQFSSKQFVDLDNISKTSVSLIKEGSIISSIEGKFKEIVLPPKRVTETNERVLQVAQIDSLQSNHTANSDMNVSRIKDLEDRLQEQQQLIEKLLSKDKKHDSVQDIEPMPAVEPSDEDLNEQKRQNLKHLLQQAEHVESPEVRRVPLNVTEKSSTPEPKLHKQSKISEKQQTEDLQVEKAEHVGDVKANYQIDDAKAGQDQAVKDKSVESKIRSPEAASQKPILEAIPKSDVVSEPPKPRFMPKLIKASQLCTDRISVKIVKADSDIDEQFAVQFRANFETEAAPNIYVLLLHKTQVFTFADVVFSTKQQTNFVFQTDFRLPLYSCGALAYFYVEFGEDFRFVQLCAAPLKSKCLEVKNTHVFSNVVAIFTNTSQQLPTAKLCDMQVQQSGLQVISKEKKAPVLAASKRLQTDVYLGSKFLLNPSSYKLQQSPNAFLLGAAMVQSTRIWNLFEFLSLEDTRYVLSEHGEAAVVKLSQDYKSRVSQDTLLILRMNGNFVILLFESQQQRDLAFVYSQIMKNASFLDVNLNNEASSPDAVSAILNLKNNDFIKEKSVQKVSKIVISDQNSVRGVGDSLVVTLAQRAFGLVHGTDNDDVVKQANQVVGQFKIPHAYQNLGLELLGISDADLEVVKLAQNIEGPPLQLEVPKKTTEFPVTVNGINGESEKAELQVDQKSVKLKSKLQGTLKTSTDKFQVRAGAEFLYLKFESVVVSVQTDACYQLLQWFGSTPKK